MLGKLGTLLGQVLERRQRQQKRQLNTEPVSCPGLAASQGWAAWCPVSALCQELEWEAQQRQQLQRRQRRRQEPMVQGCCPGPVVSQVLCPVLALCPAWFLVLEVSPGWQELGHQQEQQQQQPRQLSTELAFLVLAFPVLALEAFLVFLVFLVCLVYPVCLV